MLRIHDVEQAFTTKLGAKRDDSGDHIYFYFQHEDSEYTVGKLSHSWRQDLGPKQVHLLAQKLWLQDKEFELFVGCDMSADQMVALWLCRRPRY